MLTQKFSIFFVLLILLFQFCTTEKDVSYEVISATSIESSKLIHLKREKEIILDSGTDIIGHIMVFKMMGENFLVVDTIHSRQCYLFSSNGKLLKKIGRYGEGPGEYLHILAACISKDRIFLTGGRRINIYNKNGEFLKTTIKPFLGICNSAHAGPNGTVFVVSYNRYNTNKDTIYQLDKDGSLIKSFSPLSGIPPVFDTFFPQTGLCIEDNNIFQFFNFKYEISQCDFEGNIIKKVKISSPLYTPPDFKKANVRGHKAELKYRATFTQVNGFFNYSKGYAVLLANWKTIKKDKNIFEFWSKDFKPMGYCEINNDELPLGIFNDRLLTADFEGETKIIFWEFQNDDTQVDIKKNKI